MALTQLTDWQQIDKQPVVGTVLLEFSAAFDLIEHEILLNKLSTYGFTCLLSSGWKVISQTQKRVLFNGSLSDVKQLKCGTPQWSCLGTLIYIIFTNELPSVLEKKTCKAMYADDTTVYLSTAKLTELNTFILEELMLVANGLKKIS